MDTTTPLLHADTESRIRACWPAMQQLRPGLKDEDEFVRRVGRMQAGGYRLLAAWQDDQVAAVAGYRLLDNLVYGRFLYVDDLVSLAAARNTGLGARLVEALKTIAENAGCDSLVLDTALSNALAQRFYFRQGLLARAMGFHFKLAPSTPSTLSSSAITA